MQAQAGSSDPLPHPLAQQDYIINKLKSHKRTLQYEQDQLVTRLQQEQLQKQPVDRVHIVEALQDIKGRD
jgi:hypothetical protein